MLESCQKDTGEYLIPELCEFMDFSSHYYLKAFALPCILYRLKSLLIAEQLRSLIAKECDFPHTVNLKPLTISKINYNPNLESSIESSFNFGEENIIDIDILMQKLSCGDGNEFFSL